jgi:transcriptional regulator with XRE-family HTH domain
MDESSAEQRLCWAFTDDAVPPEGTDFCRLIKALRVNSGMSQRELGARLGTTQSAIARLEAGKVEPKLATLQKLAKAFGHDLHLHVKA